MRLTQLALTSAALVLAGCGSDHTSPGSKALPGYDLVLLHTLGGAEEGPDALSDIRGIVVDGQGRILVLDYATQQVEMFDSTGAHLRTIGRKGGGPGEMARANGLVRAPDGSLWINDPGNNRFTVFDAEGAYLRSIPLNITSFGFIWDAWFDADSALYEPIRVRQDTTWTERLRRFRNGGTTVDTLPITCEGMIPRRTREDNFIFEYKEGMTVMPIPFAPAGMRLFDRQGHAWCGMSSRYHLRRVSIFGGDTLELRGTRQPQPVTPTDLDSVKARIRQSISTFHGQDPDWARIPSAKPVIGRAVADDSGRIWINPITADSNQIWEIFSPAGVPLATVHSPVVLSRWHPMVLRGEQVVGVTRDSDEVLVIVSGRLQRRSASAGN
ncbi:MAG TPA: 6-bladed beta-propeller [Gemmatimonadales bacterium]|nr:6-bladed beta-propeller [Gemmatimonadales bacterium]